MTEQITFYAAFLMGIFSAVHCFAMCGGIASVLSTQTEARIRSSQQNFIYVLTCNLGRITSYVFFGAIAGSAAALFTSGMGNIVLIADILRIITGALLILVGIPMLSHLLSHWKGLRVIEAIGKPIWNRIAPHAQKLLPIKNLPAAFAWGILWGWLPCSMVYTLLVIALASGETGTGALIMLAFGLGTLPALVVTGMSAITLTTWLQKKSVKRLAGSLFIIAGIWIISSIVVMDHSAGSHEHAGHMGH